MERYAHIWTIESYLNMTFSVNFTKIIKLMILQFVRNDPYM